MPITTGTGTGQYPGTVRHVTNGEAATATVFARPSQDLEKRTDVVKAFAETEETRLTNHAHTGGTDGPILSRASLSGVNAANGLCGLDSAGLVSIAQLPAAVLGDLKYQGTWDAAANSPAIAPASPASGTGLGNQGWYYVVATAGSTTIDTVNDWKVGDWLVSDGVKWDKIDNTTEPNLAAINALAFGVGTPGWSISVKADGSGYELTNTGPRLTAIETFDTTHTHTGSADGPLLSRASLSDVNISNGMCGLDGNARVPLAQLPPALLGDLKYQGVWNASTNSPAIPTSSPASSSSLGNQGWYYVVGTAGSTSISGVTDWQVGDWLVSDGVKWDKIDNTTEPNLAAINALVPAVGTAGYSVSVKTDGSGYELANTGPRLTAIETFDTTHTHTGGATGPQLSRASLSDVNANSGICGLDSNGQVAIAQLPATVLGDLKYQGTWNATTNTPAIAAAAPASNSGLGNQGWYYVVATAGTTSVSGVTDWQVGDWLVSDGTKWDKIDNTTEPNLALINALGYSAGTANYSVSVNSAGTGYVLANTGPRLDGVEATNTTQNTRLTTLETAAPLRISVDSVTAGLLNIGPSLVTVTDGASVSFPPVDDVQNSFTAATLNFATATATVSEKDGVTMSAIPTPASFVPGTTTAGTLFARVALAYDTTNNKLNTHWDTNAVQGSLANPGAMFALIDGTPLGYLNLANASASIWKSASSAGTAAVLSATDLVRYGSGSGVGGGGVDKSFKLQGLSGNAATIKGGYILLSDGRVLATGTGTTTATVGKDTALNLATLIIKETGLVGYTSSTYYGLYIDLNSLGSAVTLTDSGRKVYSVTQSNFILSTSTPDVIDQRRYVWIDDLYNATLGQRPTKTHNMLGGQLPTQTYVTTVTSNATPTVTLSHGLGGVPHAVSVFYTDGTGKTFGLEPTSYIVDMTATTIVVSTAGYTLSPSTPMTVKAIYVPTQSAYFGQSRTFTSGWFTGTATTTVAHGLTDREDVRGYEVQEWDTVAAKIRNIDRSGLVVNFDDTNFYLDWTGLTPSATLKYRIVAGGSPLPYSIPNSISQLYTKTVGTNGYGTLSAALSAAGSGDHILVTQDSVESVDILINASDVKITFMPGKKINFNGTVTNACLRVIGNNVELNGVYLQVNGLTATPGLVGVKVEGTDCYLHNMRVEMNAATKTVTDAYNIASGASRTYLKGLAKTTTGTITNALTDNDGGGDVFVRG